MATVEEKYISYYNEFAVEDQEDIINVCEAASKFIWDRFRTKFDDPKLLAVTFSQIYSAFLTKLKTLESEYSDFVINICGRLEMGYSTMDDEDNEKQGNFVIFIRHLNSDRKNEEIDDPSAKAKERAVQWNTENAIDQPKLLRDVSIIAVENLKKCDIELGTSELILPIFITVYETLVNYLKIKRHEKDEFQFELNFVSCFYIGARESEDDIDDIYIRPNIEAKTNIKDDGTASSKYE